MKRLSGEVIPSPLPYEKYGEGEISFCPELKMLNSINEEKSEEIRNRRVIKRNCCCEERKTFEHKKSPGNHPGA
jgi:hypothetical protein